MRRDQLAPTSNTKGHDDFWNSALCCCRRYCALGRDFHMHADPGLGRRWANLVRRGSAHPPVRHRCARDGRQLPARATMPRRARRAGPRCVGQPGRAPRRCFPGGAHPGRRSRHDLPFRGQCRWRPDSGLVRVTAVRRPVLCDGQGWLGCAVGSVLAQSSLLIRADESGLSIRFAGDAIAIAIHTFPISRLPPIDRRDTGRACIVTAGVIG